MTFLLSKKNSLLNKKILSVNTPACNVVNFFLAKKIFELRKRFAVNRKKFLLNKGLKFSENKDMKISKIKNFLLCAVFLFASSAAFAAKSSEIPVLTDEEAFIAELATQINQVKEPFIKDDYVVFTANKTARHIGIAFDFENFKTIHSFMLKKIFDFEGNVTDSLYFYVQKLPKNIQQINYRLVVDGLWTLDPQNSNTVYSNETKLLMSHFDASREIPKVTEELPLGTVRFVYHGNPGEEVRLGGNFTNWDSYIYWMNEVSPGLYECDLPLPPGTYEYAFFIGIMSYPDNSNPQKTYTADGKVASLLVVN